MGKDTEIQWCDSTVNPTTGCDGCELWATGKGGPCYAGNLHEGRLARTLPDLYAADFTEVRLAPGRMIKAAGFSDLSGKDRPSKPWLDGIPRLIFVGDMGDVMSGPVTFPYLKSEVIDNVVSPKGSRHIWMLLTKRPAKMAAFAAFLHAEHGITWPYNLWAGTSITGRASVIRADRLLDVPSGRRFLSVEPLIEAVDISPFLGGIDLVIVGGESGSKARPFDLAWARSIRDQCKAAGVAFFMKQLGASPVGQWFAEDHQINWNPPVNHWELKDSHGGDWDEWPDDLRVRDFPDPVAMGVRS